MGTRSKKDRKLTEMPNGALVAYDHVEYRADVLPPPDELERYEKMNPGTAKAILESYIAQSNHRMELEKAVIGGDNKRANRGQIISAAITLLCMVIGGGLLYLDKDIAGLALILGSLGTLLTAFYGGAILRKIERTNKNIS